MFMLPDILVSRELPRQRETFIGLFLLLPILYGLAVSLTKGEIAPGLVEAAEWIAPLLYYFYFIANWRRVSEADALVRDFLAANGLVVISYGLFQYFQPLSWDIAWVLNSRMIGLGSPEPYGLRVFGTMNSPGPLALWLGIILMLLLHFRNRISFPLAVGGALLLLATLVRSVAGTVVLGLLLAALLGQPGVIKMALASLAALVLVGSVASAVDPKIIDNLASRFETIGSIQQDDSALVRAAIYERAPALIDAHPFGLGIGALGRGAVVSQNYDMVSVDAGPLAIYLGLGWLGGSIYLCGIGLVLAQAIVAARMSGDPAALALAVAAFASTANLVFVNMSGFWAASVWSCGAYAAALGIAQRSGSRR